MADYEFKYRLQSAPSATTDGSKMVNHDIYAIAREQGSGDDWQIVPGRHKTISVPADQIQDALAGPGIVGKYKDALAANIDTGVTPITGWTQVQLEALMDNNDESLAAAQAADAYIQSVTPAPHYPLDFNY